MEWKWTNEEFSCSKEINLLHQNDRDGNYILNLKEVVKQ